MERIEGAADLRRTLDAVRREGRTIGFVPTLGSLHAGHLSHVRQLAGRADYVVMSIFVNPLQFGEGEDFTRYPRNLEGDAALAHEAGVSLLFHPSVETMYPPGAQTVVDVPALSATLEGAVRPTHFRGVATIVTKLLNLVRPDLASFGQKDLQQLLVVRRLVVDLQLDVEIVPVPTVREPDGLALSSRNAYLTRDDRHAAPALYRACRAGVGALQSGERDPQRVEAAMAAVMHAESRVRMEYAAVRTLPDLAPPTSVCGRWALLVAARLGEARLIDNIVVEVLPGEIREALP
ncbi:MAG: pantoate--beta-alanine ligase [Clostridia bacterium]